MAELEEFKKLLVQDLARCMVEEHEPREQMWSRLNKEYGCDCNLLWERIRTLTVKKLTKMLAAEDRTESIPSIARMTSTDWLVFDKILVHENIDVVGEELILRGRPESKVLWELFILVSSYHIETLPPRDLVKGWSNLTKTYNSSGRYCSPMLLQRRWYQLKELVRKSFMGDKLCTTHDLNEASKPTKLQRMIANRCSNLLTEPFTTWDCLIKKKLVVQASDLENYSQLDQSEPTENDDAELIEIKPYIEIIDLNTDSDSDDLESRNENSSKVKKAEEINLRDICDTIREVKSEKTDSIEDDVINYGKHNDTSVSTSNATKQTFPKIVSVVGNVTTLQSKLVVINTKQYQDASGQNVITLIPKDVDMKYTLNNSSNKISSESGEFSKTIKVEIEERRNCSHNVLEKLVDDGIDDKQEESVEGNKINFVKSENHCVEQNDSTGIIDPKLLMFPITYTKKLDDMDIFKNTNYFTVKGKFIESVEAESKAIGMKAVKKEETNEAVSQDDSIECEISQIKYTSRMCQKPKYRNSNPIQLHKNPDFNIQLKNLPVKFFSNEQNRRLFNACTPVTIDIDRGFETKLVKNNLHVDNPISPIQQEKKNYECQNTVFVMPSDDSLLDKSAMSVKELLPQQHKSDISETSLNNDINVRNSVNPNQNFLTIEVSPLYDQLNDFSTKPPVKLVQYSRDTFQEYSTTSPTNSIKQKKKSDECKNIVSVITSIEESLVDKSIVNVKESLTQHNEIDMPKTSLNSSIIDGNNESYNKKLLAIEVSPIWASDTVSNINPPVKLFQCPTDTFQRNSIIPPTKSTVKLEKKSKQCDNAVSVISSTKESPFDKNTMNNIKEFLAEQNERDMPEISLDNSSIDKSIDKNVLTIEISPLNVDCIVSITNPPVKIVPCSIDKLQRNSTLDESKLDSEIVCRLKTNKMPTSKNCNRSSRRNLSVSQQAHEFLITEKTVNKVLKFLDDQSTTEIMEPDAFAITKNTLNKVLKFLNNESFGRIKNTYGTEPAKKVQKKSTYLLLKNKTNNQSEEETVNLAHYDECKKESLITSDVIIENSAYCLPILYQNPLTDPQCASTITETDNKSLSHSILPPRLSNNAASVPHGLILKREDQEEEYNGQKRKTHARSQPLIITRISSEPTHLHVPHRALRPIPPNGPSHIDLKSHDVRTSNNFEDEKTNATEPEKSQNLSNKSNCIVDNSQLNSSDYEPLTKKSKLMSDKK